MTTKITNKNTKRIKMISLIALTILMVVAVVLVVYIVDKTSVDNKQVLINEVYSRENADFVLTGLEFRLEDNQVQLLDDECVVVVKIRIEAKSTLKVNDYNFKLNGKNPTINDFGDKLVLKTKQEQVIELKYIATKGQSTSLFVEYFGCKVPLGSTINIE